MAFQMNEIKKTLQAGDPGNYLRIDYPSGVERVYSSDMSDASAQNIKALQKAGEMTLENARKNQKLDKFLDGLLV